jgi:hypothetical protein
MVKKERRKIPPAAPPDERRTIFDEAEAALPVPPSARGRAIILLAFVLVYSVACGLTAFHLEGQQERWTGVQLLVFGVVALKLGQFAWLANLTVIVALRAVMNGQTRTAQIWSGVSMLLSFHTFALFGQEIALGPQEFNHVRLVALGSGYYVWLLALLLPLIITLLLPLNPRLRKKRDFRG